MQTDEVTGRHVTLSNRLCLGRSAEAGKSAGSQRHRQQPARLQGPRSGECGLLGQRYGEGVRTLARRQCSYKPVQLRRDANEMVPLETLSPQH